MIKITKTKIDLNVDEFKNEVIELCKTIEKHNPYAYGISVQTLNKKFGIRLTIFDFYELSEKLGFTIRRNKFWYFSQVIRNE